MEHDDRSPLWSPSVDRVSSSVLDSFRRRVATARAEIVDTQTLHTWSVAEPGAFWREVWEFTGVVGEPGPIDLDPIDGSVRGARFFPGSSVNLTENLLAERNGADELAIVSYTEDGARREVRWDELRAEVAAVAAALAAEGVEPGDRIAAYMPNVVETVVTFLAANAIGAIFTSTSSDFGVEGVLDRFGQTEPVVLVAAEEYRYAGSVHDCRARVADIARRLPSLRRTVVVGPTAENTAAAIGPVAVSWAGFIEPHRGSPLTFRRAPGDQPAYILYSSGTTGKPKCITHRSLGVLLMHLKEHQLHCDIRPGDRVLYFTTCGWMMWNWLVGALATGATIVLYDGSPFHPTPAVLFDLVDRERITLLGLSAKFIDAADKAGLEPGATHELGSLRTICSTGSPLGVAGFEWVYRAVRADVHLASISGGTDLCGCFLAGDPTRPVYAGEIQGPSLGMAVDVFDTDGRPVRGPGITGELVCTRPFPSVPLGFWGDDGDRFHAAYFARFPGAWAHGDFASWTGHGGMIIHGRSDATLNASGVRIGTAEIYSRVEGFAEVLEAVAVGQEWDGDTRIVLFVRLVPGCHLDDDLVGRIRHRLRTDASPRHVPARILEVTDVPRTRSNKISELAVADVVNGREVRNTEALANPDALEQYRDRPELDV